VGKRAGIKAADMLNMLDAQAHVCQTSDGLIPAELVRLDRFDARKRVVELMDEDGLLEKVEDRVIQTPYGDRGGVVIEPWLTDQWYVDAETLAKAPMEAVRSGAIEIVPKSWEKTFFNWMENIQPWCVSRQLWWGHRIPAWYADDGSIYVAETEEEAQAQAGNKALKRDEDVLDTWFSSALWPFATLGWPDESALLAKHYPNDLLISGFDILFFWDARMAMQGIHFMKEVPWKRLYLHGLVRAADGQKMSKSKGNVVDPLGLIDQYGADALRFFMAAMESQGRDVKMDEKRVEGYRNFATKLWNAARFCQSNGIGASTSIAAPAATSAVNRWIISEVIETVTALDKAMADLRFDAAANTIYQFAWSQFCDWYIELIKGSFDDETKAVAGWVLDQILVMLHPFMPFVTEELWSKMGARPHELIVAKWPEPEATVDRQAKAEVEWLIALVGNLRGAKAELGISPGARLTAYLAEPSETTRATIGRNAGAIDRLARLDAIRFEPAPAGPAMQIGAGDAMLAIPLEGVIDLASEKARLEKALATSLKERDSLGKRLENPAFVEKAKPEAVDKAKADHAAHAAEAERLQAALARLG
jgi:valyl-tRNA synthetase